MSYRTIKRMLGETSLERKCRFLFGGGLLLLITGSFYTYAWLTKDLVYRQNTTTAQMLIKPIILEKHWLYFERDFFQPVIEEMSASLQPEGLRDYSYALIRADPANAPASERPADPFGHEALDRLKQGASEVVRKLPEQGEYHYYGEVRATKSCLRCHSAANPTINNEGQPVSTARAEGDLLGMVKITLPLDSTNQALAGHNAVLITTALVTACLAMLALYAVVRYVIVKPVLHLKDVSDEIARGTLDLRADIHTGDEFEELSHAFNRMLRHLVTVQEELREVNTDLDGKVDQLAQVNLQLYEMNKLKDEFLATMSHELRTPLNSILGFSDIIAGSPNLTEKQKRFVHNIQTSGNHLMLLINDLLDLAKIESGKMDVQIVEFSLNDLAERQVASLGPMAQRKNIDLTTDIDPAIPPLVQDPGKLQQILNNLLSNAIKFTPEGGRVRVRAGMHGDDMLELIVEDTGVGIPLEDQEAIFEKFRQGRSIPGQEDAMTREHGGTGLGLSIVKELCKLLGGEVLLESEFGKGSTFIVRVPARLDKQAHRMKADLLHPSVEINRAGQRLLERAASRTRSDGQDADSEQNSDESAA